MGLRDIVRFAPNERVDLIDFQDIQRNGRSDTRHGLRALLIGDASGAPGTRYLFGGWSIAEDSPASSTFIVTAGRGLGREALPDGSEESGVVFGDIDGPDEQEVDMTGNPVALYTVYVRFSHTPGTIGNRIFWNQNTELEEADAIETRLVASWDVQVGTSSPGTEWQAIGTVDWDGSTVQSGDITQTRNMFFEGQEPGFAHEWGDGGSDRSANRGTNGVQDLYTWVHAIRRQIEEIVGDNQRWYEDFTKLTSFRFQVEGVTSSRFWISDHFSHNPSVGASTFDLVARTTGVGTIAGQAGGDLLLSVSGGGTFTIDLDSGADFTLDVAAGGSVEIASDDFDVSGGVVDAQAYSYQTSERVIRTFDLIPKLFPLYDGGLDPTFDLHDNGESQLAHTTALGVAGDLAPSIVWASDAGSGSWFFEFPIDEVILEGATLHSIAITWWATAGNNCVVDVLLKSVLRTGAATAFSTLETQSATWNGDSQRQTTEFVFDQGVGWANFYRLRIERDSGTTENLQILAVQITLDVTSVEQGIGHV